jgi:CPA1 family monovalent cation:H+ antiporter
MLTTEIALLSLLLIACLAAIALKRLQVPFTVGLVIIGLVAGWLGNKIPGLAILQEITLSHELILFLFVPPLVFELPCTHKLILREFPAPENRFKSPKSMN